MAGELPEPVSYTHLDVYKRQGHSGAYNNAMEISRTKGRILIFMVQQNGPWGTAEGKTIVKTLEPLAESVAASAGVPNAAAEPEKH